MQTFIILSVAASMANVALAVPHGLAHRKFHAVHDFGAVVGSPLSHDHPRRANPVSVDLENGTCGGSTGFGCAAGFCCSQWGYCGLGDAYCGAGGNNANSIGSAPQPPATSAANSPSNPTTVVASGAPTPGKPNGKGPSPTLPSAATTFVPSTTLSPSNVAPQSSSAESSPNPTSTTAPSPSSPAGGSGSGSSGGFGDVFKMYSGNGDASAGWPTTGDWTDFESMWSANEANMMQSCAQFGQPNNSEQETADVKSAIQSVGASAGVDPRFILAVVLQESAGCVRAPTTNYGVTNPGLMQSHDGTGSCNNGQVQNPCPMSEITQMIQDGAAGTSSGDGLKQCLAQAPGASSPAAAKYYQAARIYNSGSIAPSGNLDEGIATLCYSADIANRLTGWVDAPTTCNL